MGDRFKKIIEPWLGLTFALCVAMIFQFLLNHVNILFDVFGKMYGLTRTILIGMAIAYIFNPFMVFLENLFSDFIRNEKRRHLTAVAVTFVTILAGVMVLFSLLIPQIMDGVVNVFNNRGNIVRTISNLLDSLNKTASSYHIDTSQVTEAVNAKVREIVGMIPSNIVGIVSTSVNIGSGIFNIVIAFILAGYFLTDKKSMVTGINRLRHALMSDKAYEQHTRFFVRCHNILIRYVGCDLLDAVIVAAFNAMFMAVFRMSYIPLISTIVGVTNLVPTFGPIVGALTGALIILMEDPWHSLWFLIFSMLLQTVDGYYLKPKLFGDTLGVPSVWILITVIVGGRLFGVIGVLLAIPFAAIFTFVYQELIMSRLENRKEEKQIRKNESPEALEKRLENNPLYRLLRFLKLAPEPEDAGTKKEEADAREEVKKAVKEAKEAADGG
ncbi:MAG: AI-2E family transporter [Lachnospiraceae bacterium]|nr:AI-2E family transporter [Lachnospiraceae bacterium]